MKEIDEKDIPVEALAFYGIDATKLKQNQKIWNKFIHGEQTPLLGIHFKDLNGEEHWDSGKLRLYQKEDNTYGIKVAHVQSRLDLTKPFWGYSFSEKEQNKLSGDGELGYPIILNVAGKEIEALVGVDRQLNTPAFRPVNTIFIADKIKNAKMLPVEKKIIREGGFVYKENVQLDKDKPELSNVIMSFSVGDDCIKFRTPTPELMLTASKQLEEQLSKEIPEHVQKNIQERIKDSLEKMPTNQNEKKMRKRKTRGI